MTKLEKIYKNLNEYQKSVLGAISYYGGYDLYDNGGLLPNVISNYNELFAGVVDINSALEFYDMFVEEDKENGLCNNDSISVETDYELSKQGATSVFQCREMLIQAIRTKTDIYDLIEQDFQPKGEQMVRSCNNE